MKPVYDPYFMRWKVKGLGWFDTRAEASEAIKKLGHDATLIIRIKSDLKQRLETLAQERNKTVSELVRELIEKEVKDYGE
jgi:hypothetical protein